MRVCSITKWVMRVCYERECYERIDMSPCRLDARLRRWSPGRLPAGHRERTHTERENNWWCGVRNKGVL